MKLVIVESPTKARTLSRFLPKEFVIESSMGHVRDLPKSGLNIDVENKFEPKYAVIPSKKKIVTVLKKEAKGADEIYLATDPDREGEAIAYHVAHILGRNDYKRVTFHEITKDAIEHAIETPGKMNMALVDAQQARRILDRLVGYTLSPVLWKKIRRGLSAGRVQSVAVRLIVEKEKEIEAFKPDEYWEIFVDLEAKSGEFTAEVTKKEDRTLKVKDKNTADSVVADLEKADYVVNDVKEKEYRSSPPAPFTTSTLQQTAARYMGWSSKRTMSVAQALYESGFITYHRTDSHNLAVSAILKTRSFIDKDYGKKYLPSRERVYRTKSKSAQEAHEAIRPTDVFTLSDAVVGGRRNQAHVKLYDLIRTRMLQCQMSDAIYDNTTILVEADKYELKAKGKRLLFDGWLKLGKLTDDEIVPKVSAGEKLEQKKIDPQQKFTKPPARYSEASLIKELEKRGIGRPSTYASIISTIQDRTYVVKEEKRFKPTSVGTTVTDFLVEHFGDVMAYEFTAKMENDLDAIAQDKKQWIKVVGDFWDPFKRRVKKVEKESKRVGIPVEQTGKKCPKCKEGDLVIRFGKFGKFLSCSTFPECDYSDQYFEYVEGNECPDDGGRIVIRRTRSGRTFYGCENYPKCRWATWNQPKPGQELMKTEDKPKRVKKSR